MQFAFVIPGDIHQPTGGYHYDRNIISNINAKGVECKLFSLDGEYPFPSEKDRANALHSISDIAEVEVVVVDGLAGGAMPEFIEKLASKSKVIALIHHPLYLENGLAEAEKEALLKSEHKGLEFVTAVITTSPTTALEVTKTFGFQKEKIATVLPGVDRGSVSKPKQTGTINLLCVGSVIERKGHLVLIEALSRLKSLDWKLECIGLFAMDDPLSEQILLALENSELSDRITFHGAVPEAELESAYNAADVFVLPSFYEGYGMAYAEAIVRGLPVIGTKAGAIPDTVPDGCGLLIDPGNSLQLSRALETMISDADERNRFRMNAIASSSTFPTWRESAGKFLEFLEKFT